MKFLFVGTNPEKTGAATHFVALAQAMSESGHGVDMVTSSGGCIEQELAGTKVRVHQALFRNAVDLRGYVKVFSAARSSKPDWLVGNFGKEYWPLIIIGRILNVPVVLFRHRTPPFKRFSGYFLPRLARRFFAVSRYAREAYIDRGMPAERVRVLYNPVNTALYRPDVEQCRTLRRSLGLDDSAIVLGYSGRMHGGKGIFCLFEAAVAAMAINPLLHCLWLGDGPDSPALRELAAAHATARRHHFIGWVNEGHVYYSAMSMLAFPSIAPETFGRVSIEAQAAGIPVLGSNIGGIPETLDPGVTGVLLPPGNVEAWRDAILALCDSQIRLPMGAAARQFVVARFSMPVIAAEFMDDLMDRRSGR
jgi:glycosyltransferase involved in cell wall biosynthesis